MSNNIAISAFSDFLTFFKLWFPVNTGVALFDSYRKRRAEEGFHTLIAALKDGDFSKVYDDDKVAIMYQYSLAIVSGRANRNLKLLANLIRNICSGKQLNYGEYTEEYSKFAKILEDLSREEITILSVYAKFMNKQPEKVYDMAEATKNEADEAVFKKEESEMVSLYLKVKEYCANNNIMDTATFFAACTALHRTGLIYNNGGFDGGAEFPTKRFFELKELVDLNISYDNI